MNDIAILHIFTGSVLLGVGLLMKLLPPKKINSFYGYRTPRSTKNQRAWDEANTYSAELLLWAGISTIVIQAIGYALLPTPTSLLIAVGYYLIFLIVMIALTERRLKAKGF